MGEPHGPRVQVCRPHPEGQNHHSSQRWQKEDISSDHVGSLQKCCLARTTIHGGLGLELDPVCVSEQKTKMLGQFLGSNPFLQEPQSFLCFHLLFCALALFLSQNLTSSESECCEVWRLSNVSDIFASLLFKFLQRNRGCLYNIYGYIEATAQRSSARAAWPLSSSQRAVLWSVWTHVSVFVCRLWRSSEPRRRQSTAELSWRPRRRRPDSTCAEQRCVCACV